MPFRKVYQEVTGKILPLRARPSIAYPRGVAPSKTLILAMEEQNKPNVTVAKQAKGEVKRVELLQEAVQWCKDTEATAGKCLELPRFKSLKHRTIHRRLTGEVKMGASKNSHSRVMTNSEEGHNFRFRAKTTHEVVEAPFYFFALQLGLCQIEYKFENSVPRESRIARRDPGI